jgi:hypothetical protein
VRPISRSAISFAVSSDIDPPFSGRAQAFSKTPPSYGPRPPESMP